MSVDSPDVVHSRPGLDFGQGFYLTSYLEQAENWAQRKVMRSGGVPTLSEFEFNEEVIKESDEYRVLQFGESGREWLDFVCACRHGGRDYLNWDLIIGGVADDKVFYAIDMYFNGGWDAETTLRALKFYQINDQYCFVTQKAIDELLSFLNTRTREL